VRRRLSSIIVAIVVGANFAACASGYFVFDRSVRSSPLAKADAIVVLGGEHDGREEYAISLAQRGFASSVVLSNPYQIDDQLMRRLCGARYRAIDVICERPLAITTKGEAIMTRELAAARQWTRLIVVTWKFHIPRARFIFDHCLSPGAAVSYVAVPRQYAYSLSAWNSQYVYQYVAFAKAAVTPTCG
jgi:uncharacterized SAM-binding protein YcdF (DUF218 family)